MKLTTRPTTNSNGATHYVLWVMCARPLWGVGSGRPEPRWKACTK